MKGEGDSICKGEVDKLRADTCLGAEVGWGGGGEKWRKEMNEDKAKDT